MTNRAFRGMNEKQAGYAKIVTHQQTDLVKRCLTLKIYN